MTGLDVLAVALLLALMLLVLHWGREDRLERIATEIAGRSHDAEHVLRVADGFDGDRRLIALLHDSIEDGYARGPDLDAFPVIVQNAVGHLTRCEGEPYADYIERVRTAPGKAGEYARAVKRADLRDNLRRSTNSEYESLARRYHRALRLLRTS